MVFPLCFASLTTCKCPPSCVLIKCQNVIAVERLMHCVTMMMPATAVAVMAGRLVFEAGSKFGLLCSAAASTACCSATSCCCSPSSSNFLPQATPSQSRQVASGAGCCSRPESRRLGAILPEFRRSPEFSLSQTQAVEVSGVDANGIQVTGRPGNS